jgi:hypothetical protein
MILLRKQDTTMKLTFTNKSGGNLLGCVTSKLSNGVTLQNAAVPWTTGLITIFLLLIGGILGAVGATQSGTASTPQAGTGQGAGQGVGQGAGNNAAVTSGDPQGAMHATTGAVAGHTGPPAGHTDPLTLFLHFQFISSTGLLSITYPLLYQSFAANFAWANFILPIKSLINAAIHMRKCDIDPKDIKIPVVSPGLSKGISTYLARMGINEQDIFGLIYLVFLCVCAALLGLYLIAKGILQILAARAAVENRAAWEARGIQVTHMASNNTLRLVRNSLLLGVTHVSFTLINFIVDAGAWHPSNICFLSMDPKMCLAPHFLPLCQHIGAYLVNAWRHFILPSAHGQGTRRPPETILKRLHLYRPLGVII